MLRSVASQLIVHRASVRRHALKLRAFDSGTSLDRGVSRPMGSIFAGFDRESYPGDATMRSLLRDTNLHWCGFYLGPYYDWGPNYQKIKAMGWGVAPIYFRKAALGPTLHGILRSTPTTRRCVTRSSMRWGAATAPRPCGTREARASVHRQ